MGGEVCYRKGYERGPWFEIECVKQTILSKEDRGGDASFERNILTSWAKYPGYEGATKALMECRTREKPTQRRVKGGSNVLGR